MQVAATSGWLESRLAPGFRIRPEWLWSEQRPTTYEALQEIAR